MSIHTLRKRFVRDRSLPIQVLQSPYFEYFIDLYEELYGSRTQYEAFMKEVEKLGGEESFLQYYNEIKDKVITHLKNKESYLRFNADRLEEYNVKEGISKSALYHTENEAKTFISIDLKKANFQALRFYDEDILDGFDDYKQWIKQFTDSEYISNSKYIRQVIFGNLNPKKQQKIQKYIVHQLLTVISKHFTTEEIMLTSADEIVLRYKDIDLEEFKNEIENVFEKKIHVHLDAFLLFVQEPHAQLGYVKEYLNDDETVEFKSVPALFMPQAFKKYYDMKINKQDLAFYHEGFVAHFETTVQGFKPIDGDENYEL